jgi:hypothetical protein
LKEKGKKIIEDEDDELLLQLQEPDSNEEAMKYNFHPFGEEDMLNPTFRIGQSFPGIDIVR